MWLDKKTPFEKEMLALQKREERFINGRAEKRESYINQKLADKVPQKLQGTLDKAFYGAFALIFEKGTTVIEKTYNKEEIENTYKVNEFADNISQNRKTLRAFSKKASGSGMKNIMLSGVSGIGLGALGIGIPDIPIFTGMLLKSIYEIALSYGFEYESEKEKYFILMIIQGAVSYGDKLKHIDKMLNTFIESDEIPVSYNRSTLIKSTSAELSKELLYMKFLQGIPVVGIVGGAYDVIYMNRITEYAKLKYNHRFLRKKSL